MITGTKHISIRDGEQTVMEDYALIQKKDRAGTDGKNIKCPILILTSDIPLQASKINFLIDHSGWWRLSIIIVCCMRILTLLWVHNKGFWIL